MSDFKTVAHINDLQPNEATVVSYGRMWVILFNIEGTYYAIEDRCSHADVELSDGQIDLQACQIQCPKHGSKFDIKSGAALTPPAILPVRVFDVRTENEDIQIALRPLKGNS